MQRYHTSSSTLRLAISLLVLLVSLGAGAQGAFKYQRDTIPFFRGFAVSVDLAGIGQQVFSDRGQFEAALRLNLHDQYFPIFELGYGRANHEDDEATHLTYKTGAPYFRVGVDVNIMKKKHTGNRVFAGLRYGFTSYKMDVSRKAFPDPVWGWSTLYESTGNSCSQHWAEVLLGLDAKVYGPLHVGWSVRYRLRLAHKEGDIGTSWYVPGFGVQDTKNLGLGFYAAIDI